MARQQDGLGANLLFVTPETPSDIAQTGRDHVDEYLVEDEVLTAARTRGENLGCQPISRGGAAALRLLAATLQAKAIVEVGTGAGVSSLCLLSGMDQDGVLTSIDIEPEHQRAAKQAFAEAGIPNSRVRLIMGQALDVLPRLTDGAYDMVFIDATKAEYPRYHEQGVRLLRPGGVIAFDNVLGMGHVTDPIRRDQENSALRDLSNAMRDDERLIPALLPLGDGLLVAAKTRN